MKSSKIILGIWCAQLLFGNVVKADPIEERFNRKAEEVGETVALSGKWETKCTPHKVEGLTHARFEYNFGLGGGFTKLEKFYDDDSCDDDHLYLTYTVEGQIKKMERSEKETDIHHITFVAQKHKMTVYSQEASDWANKHNLCRRDDWRPNANVTVDGYNCSGYVFNPNTNVNDIYKKEDKQMRFGKTSFFRPQQKADSRPSGLNNRIVYFAK